MRKKANRLKGLVFLIASMLFLIIMLITGCDPVGTTGTVGAGLSGELVLEGRYRNVDGSTPEVEITPESLPEGVEFETVKATINGSDVTITISGLTLSGVTIVDEVDVEEEVDGQFTNYAEFTASITNVTDLAVVLVLDKSESLGNDFWQVQDYAKEFLDTVQYESNTSAKMGLVSFATAVEDHGELTTNYSTIQNEIDKLSQGQYTKFYDAVELGLSKLTATDAEGKALVAFTDGVDNYSALTKPAIIDAVQESDGVKVFTIGLGDTVNPTVLKEIATSVDYTRVAPDIDTLGSIFNEFANTVSGIFTVSYTRNNQVISDWRSMRILLN